MFTGMAFVQPCHFDKIDNNKVQFVEKICTLDRQLTFSFVIFSV